MSKETAVGNENQNNFKKHLANLKSGIGSIVCISGEQAYGKTYLMQQFETLSSGREYEAIPVLVECQTPIGNFSLGNIQPLLPFTKAIIKLNENKEFSAKKLLALNIGMTALASIPLIGDVFYATKEITRDLRQYKNDIKAREVQSKTHVSSGSAEYYEKICFIADKKHLVILIDDFHYADAQSIELLDLFAGNISKIPVIIVVSYRKSVIQSHASPLHGFIRKYIETGKFDEIELEPLSIGQVGLLCKSKLPAYIQNRKFEGWLIEQSLGVPGVIIEYLKYFINNPPMRADGTFNEDFLDTKFMPSSVHNAFSQTIEKLSDEERNTLAVCSAEGREFTSLVVSELLKCDVLTTIKKLRSLQHKTDIFKSIGAHFRYGVKTTVYRFTQAFYHSYFEKTLEYEEHVALHGQIAALLKTKYNESDEMIREEIAPFIAAHSAEAGDDSTAKEMLLASAQYAQKYGNADVIKETYDTFSNIGTKTTQENENSEADNLFFSEVIKSMEPSYENSLQELQDGNEEGKPTGTKIDFEFSSSRKAVIKEFLAGHFEQAAELALALITNHNDAMNPYEKSQLFSFAGRAYSESENWQDAERYCTEALSVLEENNSQSVNQDIRPALFAESLAANAIAVLRATRGSRGESLEILRKLASKSDNLATELQLLTMINIGNILENNDPLEARKYITAAKEISNKLNFSTLSAEI
ncbi:MAG: 16 protein [Ignavibacteria bacterium]|nr:16 protein [Ignavibacteria bacterium]